MMLNFHWISCPFPNDVFQMILAWIFDLEKQLPLYWLCYSREVNHLVISNMRLAILGHSHVTAVRRSEALRHASHDGQDTRLASRSRHASNNSSKDQQKQHGSSTESGTHTLYVLHLYSLYICISLSLSLSLSR